MKINFMFLILSVVSCYNIVIFPGSRVPLNKYRNLQKSLESTLGTSVSIKRYNPFKKLPEDSIIIGHSFGGTFALIEAINNEKNVKAVVLLNSHFNTRHKMPYPGIDMNSVHQPVLTILGKNDSQLPYKKAIDDYFFAEENFISNKHFIIDENLTHYSCIDESENTFIIDNICTFIQSFDYYQAPPNNYKWFTKHILFPKTQDIAYSLNFLDALLKIVKFPLWQTMHFLYFLTLKPSVYTNYQYSLENSCLIKTYNVTENTVETFLTKEIQDRYNITWTKTKLPTIHPSILVWLCKQPKVNEIIVLPINKELTYFKIPSLRWFTQKL
jgi:hypothetical protein